MEKSKNTTTTVEQSNQLLRDELNMALLAAEDIRALRAKMVTLVTRIREEKERRMTVVQQKASVEKSLSILSDHLEKLMTLLRIETKTRGKTVENLKESRRNLFEAKCLCDKQKRLIDSKDKYIAELEYGSQLLEDQLKLMDLKYIDIRKKLDFAREQYSVEVIRNKKEVSKLRRKFQFIVGGNTLLDCVKVPSAQTADTPVQHVHYDPATSGPISPVANQSETLAHPLTRSKSAALSRSQNGSDGFRTAFTSNADKRPPTIDKVISKVNMQKDKADRVWSVDAAVKLVNDFEVASKKRPKTAAASPKVE